MILSPIEQDIIIRYRSGEKMNMFQYTKKLHGVDMIVVRPESYVDIFGYIELEKFKEVIRL